MTTEQYKEHLKTIIRMVFMAELEIETPEIDKRLKDKTISPDEYFGLIADEILSHTPASMYADERY